MSKVLDIIEAANLTVWNKEAVFDAVIAAAEHYLREDRGWTVLDIERYISTPIRAKIDLVLQQDRQLKVVDWKLTLSKLDDRWALRQFRSWQLRLYAMVLASVYNVEFPVIGEFRGIRLGDDDTKIQEVRVEVTEADVQEARAYVNGIHAMRDSLIVLDYQPWPKFDSGCRCYGPLYACEFEKICWEKKELPGRVEEFPPLSFSRIGEFIRCPERYRQLLKQREEETSPMLEAGRAFHDAIAELYQEEFVNVNNTGNAEESEEKSRPVQG